MDLDAELDQAPAWRRDALCLSADRDMFFPAKGTNHDAAKAICGHCTVRDECLDYVLALEDDPEYGGRHGVWAGLSPKEREALSGARRAA